MTEPGFRRTAAAPSAAGTPLTAQWPLRDLHTWLPGAAPNSPWIQSLRSRRTASRALEAVSPVWTAAFRPYRQRTRHPVPRRAAKTGHVMRCRRQTRGAAWTGGSHLAPTALACHTASSLKTQHRASRAPIIDRTGLRDRPQALLARHVRWPCEMPPSHTLSGPANLSSKTTASSAPRTGHAPVARSHRAQSSRDLRRRPLPCASLANATKAQSRSRTSLADESPW